MIVSHSSYAGGYLLHDDRCFYSVIVRPSPYGWVDGLGCPLPAAYKRYTDENLPAPKVDGD